MNAISKDINTCINNNSINHMKSFNNYSSNQDEFLIEGINLRSISTIALVTKSNAVSKNVQSIQITDKELDKKLNLLSKQILYSSLLTAQLGLMKNKKR